LVEEVSTEAVAVSMGVVLGEDFVEVVSTAVASMAVDFTVVASEERGSASD
jgi:hypothetical protein